MAQVLQRNKTLEIVTFPNLLVSITHYLCNLIISEFDCTQEFTDEIGELRAISGHVLRATGVQIPEDDLDNLHSLREVDGILVFVDPQDLLGSCLLADIIKNNWIHRKALH
ncbi:hypothetical protein Tco_0563949 [Tanacetum coccineum]